MFSIKGVRKNVVTLSVVTLAIAGTISLASVMGPGLASADGPTPVGTVGEPVLTPLIPPGDIPTVRPGPYNPNPNNNPRLSLSSLAWGGTQP